MALTISQISAVSYVAVLNEKRKAQNQWEESALLRTLERQGGIDRKSFGDTLETTLDYRANPGAEFLVTDMQPVSLNKTEVVTAASYAIAELSVPVTWSKKDEVRNPTENQKVALVKTLLENGISSHDDKIERALFTTSTNGFIGLLNMITDAGTGTIGGIDASADTFWKNQFATYVDDTDIEATFTTVYNNCAKGSGSKLKPTILVSDGATQALYEGVLQAQQRWVDSNEANGGFRMLKFKDADYVYSQYGTSRVFFLNPTNFKLEVSKEYFRDKGDTQELEGQNGFSFKIYSALQAMTNNRSRLGVAHT